MDNPEHLPLECDLLPQLRYKVVQVTLLRERGNLGTRLDDQMTHPSSNEVIETRQTEPYTHSNGIE